MSNKSNLIHTMSELGQRVVSSNMTTYRYVDESHESLTIQSMMSFVKKLNRAGLISDTKMRLSENTNDPLSTKLVGTTQSGLLVKFYSTPQNVVLEMTGRNDRMHQVSTILNKHLGEAAMDSITIKHGIEDEEITIRYDELNPNVWAMGKMHPDIRAILMKNAKHFLEFSEFDDVSDIEDIILTGSIANYNWNEHSDFDLHIMIDMAKLEKKYGPKFALLCDVQRKLYKLTREVYVKGHEVELYFQDSNEEHVSTGIYSIMNDKWIIEPQVMEVTIESDDLDELIAQWESDIDDLINDPHATAVSYEMLMKKLVNFRKRGLAEVGELSLENMTFKSLRNSGHIERLQNARNAKITKSLTLE